MFIRMSMATLPYEGATEAQLQHHLVRHFLSIHDMFRNQLQAIIDYADDLLSGDAQLSDPQTKARIQALIQAGSQYTHYLHFHHHGETDALFPALEKEGLDAAIVDKLNADHD